MKTKIITFFVLLLAVLPIQANTLRVEDKKDIELKGDTEDDNTKSLNFLFGAYQVDNQKVCIISYDAYSNIRIHILNSSGQTIDYFALSLASMQVFSFDINGYPNGTYTLIISTPQGTNLTGVFEVNL